MNVRNNDTVDHKIVVGDQLLRGQEGVLGVGKMNLGQLRLGGRCSKTQCLSPNDMHQTWPRTGSWLQAQRRGKMATKTRFTPNERVIGAINRGKWGMGDNWWLLPTIWRKKYGREEGKGREWSDFHQYPHTHIYTHPTNAFPGPLMLSSREPFCRKKRTPFQREPGSEGSLPPPSEIFFGIRWRVDAKKKLPPPPADTWEAVVRGNSPKKILLRGTRKGKTRDQPIPHTQNDGPIPPPPVGCSQLSKYKGGPNSYVTNLARTQIEVKFPDRQKRRFNKGANLAGTKG